MTTEHCIECGGWGVTIRDGERKKCACGSNELRELVKTAINSASVDIAGAEYQDAGRIADEAIWSKP